MHEFAFEKKITIGNLIEIACLMTVLVAGYIRMESSNEHMLEKLQILSQDIDRLKNQYVRADLHDYQMKIVDQKLEEIRIDVKEIKRVVK